MPDAGVEAPQADARRRGDRVEHLSGLTPQRQQGASLAQRRRQLVHGPARRSHHQILHLHHTFYCSTCLCIQPCISNLGLRLAEVRDAAEQFLKRFCRFTRMPACVSSVTFPQSSAGLLRRRLQASSSHQPCMFVIFTVAGSDTPCPVLLQKRAAGPSVKRSESSHTSTVSALVK